MNRKYIVVRRVCAPTTKGHHRWKPIGETNDDIVCTQPACWPTGTVHQRPRIYFLAVVTNDWQLSMADVGLPITPARKSSDSRRNAYTGTRRNVVLSFIQRASIPASTIHYRPWNALHGPPFSTPDVALTLLNNLDMFTTL